MGIRFCSRGRTALPSASKHISGLQDRRKFILLCRTLQAWCGFSGRNNRFGGSLHYNRVTCWTKGKLAAIADQTCIFVHVDGSAEVVTEFRDAAKSRGWSQIGVFGIKVPRRWQSQRIVERVPPHRNISNAINDACRNYRVDRA